MDGLATGAHGVAPPGLGHNRKVSLMGPKSASAESGHTGVLFYEFMRFLNQILRPNSYFEIGTQAGGTLAKFTCDALCVDPEFKVQSNVISGRKRTFFFQMPSDEFFADNDLRTYFPRGVDLAFLDGMHRFEFLLRDFLHTEKCCHARSIILLHDCLPTNGRMAQRVEPENEGWTGDVWKVLPILQKYRPDLRIFVLDCPPSGLVVCTGLKQDSRTLEEQYLNIVDEYFPMTLEEFGVDRLWNLYPTLKSAELIDTPADLSAIMTVV